MQTKLGQTGRIEISDIEPGCGLRFMTIYSPSLYGRGDVTLYAPPGLEQIKSVPVVLLLHGVYGSHWAWFLKGAAHHTAEQLIAQKKIRPMLLVSPSDGLSQDGSAYIRHSGRDFERWIVEDIPQALTRCLPCVDLHSPLFLSGFSMGGFGALRLGAKYPARFHGISAHSSITHIREMGLFVHEPFPSYEIAADEANILFWIGKNHKHLPSFRLDCGLDDPLLGGNRRFHEQLQCMQIPHCYQEFPGGHEWSYWRNHLVETLLFFEEIFARE